MTTTTYPGIDYSLGQSNVCRASGIHFGVISQHSLLPEAIEDFEAEYGPPHCPKCGSQADEPKACEDYICVHCRYAFGSESAFGDEPIGFSYNREGYAIGSCLDSDYVVTKSPFYTFAQFCSPCVPGAGNLDHPCEDGPKTFALGHDWFEDGKAPYPLYSVETGKLVESRMN